MDKFNQSQQTQVVTKTLSKEELEAKPKKGKHGANRLNHVQHFKLCEWLRNNEEKIREQPWVGADLCKVVSEALGFTINLKTLYRAAELVNVKWATPVPKRPQSKTKDTQSAIRNLAASQIEICRQLGIHPTAGLQSVYDNYCRAKPTQQQNNDTQEHK